MLLSLAIAR